MKPFADLFWIFQMLSHRHLELEGDLDQLFLIFQGVKDL